MPTSVSSCRSTTGSRVRAGFRHAIHDDAQRLVGVGHDGAPLADVAERIDRVLAAHMCSSRFTRLFFTDFLARGKKGWN
jgi:hypothetical protein